MVSRSELDMLDIREIFRTKYEKSLYSMIKVSRASRGTERGRELTAVAGLGDHPLEDRNGPGKLGIAGEFQKPLPCDTFTEFKAVQQRSECLGVLVSHEAQEAGRAGS